MLMIGGALGGLEAEIFPAVAPGFWALIGLAAVLGGVMRSPLTGVIFAVELTHRYDALLPALIAATAAYACSVLILRRSILTEKIARRGIHLSRDYSVDPLEILLVGDVMTSAAAIREDGSPGPVAHADDTLRACVHLMADGGLTSLPVVDRADPRLVLGDVTLEQLLEARLRDLREDRHSERVLRLSDLVGGRRGENDEAAELREPAPPPII
jgi:hypothetical protein